VEIARGGDANQAEMMVIEELRGLGKVMLGHWAKSSHDEAITKAKVSEPNLSTHTKKTLVAYHIRMHQHSRASAPERAARPERSPVP
jgi:hypothetical protein